MPHDVANRSNAADDGAASEVSSSPTELIQSSESEGTDTGANSGDTLATQSEPTGEATNATIGKTANEAATLAAETGEEGKEADDSAQPAGRY